MFGYIKPDSKELKVKEYDLYKAAYCGLCRVMGKRYSFLYKMTLSYDFVFMVLLRLLACPETVTFSQKRCIAHLSKKKLMMNENEALKTASDVGVIMLYHDFLDKIKDKDTNKRILYRIALPELKRLRKKACKDPLIAEFDKSVETGLKKLSEYEKTKVASIDIPANEFGCILGEALSVTYTGDMKRTVYEIGKKLGKRIYIIDCADDLEKDEKRGNYNPLLVLYESAENARKHGDIINTALLNELNDAYKAFVLIDNTDNGLADIIDNIIRIGNINTQESILKKNSFLPA